MSSVRDRVTHAVLGLAHAEDDLVALAHHRGFDPIAVKHLMADARERLRLACAAAGLVPELRVRMGDHGTPEVRRA